jgi:hypothetical protein
MNCKISLYSMAKYVKLVAFGSAVLFLVYQLFSFMLPFADQLRNWVIITIVSLWVFATIKVLQAHGLNVKGYFIFTGCLLLLYSLQLFIVVALYEIMHVVVKPYFFPWGYGVAVAASVLGVLEIFLCITKHTLLKQEKLFKKSNG